MTQSGILQQVDFFRGLNADQLAELNRITAEEQYSTGDIICQQGDIADNFYILSKGEVEVVHIEEDGTEKHLAVLEPGQYFGEVGILNQGRRIAGRHLCHASAWLQAVKESFVR